MTAKCLLQSPWIDSATPSVRKNYKKQEENHQNRDKPEENLPMLFNTPTCQKICDKILLATPRNLITAKKGGVLVTDSRAKI